jgi:hypothetical protein
MKNEKDIQTEESLTPLIDRKQAIKKTGYIALTAATTMLLLSVPKQASASPAAPGAWPGTP